MIYLSPSGIFHQTTKSVRKPIKNVVPYMFDILLVEDGAKMHHFFDYILVPHAAFIESAFAETTNRTPLQPFFDEAKTGHSCVLPYNYIELCWEHSCVMDGTHQRSMIYPMIKGKDSSKSALPKNLTTYTVAMTNLSSYRNLPFRINEELAISDNAGRAAMTSLFRFRVADAINGVLSEICHFASPQERNDTREAMNQFAVENKGEK